MALPSLRVTFEQKNVQDYVSRTATIGFVVFLLFVFVVVLFSELFAVYGIPPRGKILYRSKHIYRKFNCVKHVSPGLYWEKREGKLLF